MQLKALIAGLVLGLVGALPAMACTLTIGTGGVLGLSMDGRRMSSNEGGVSSVVTIANLSLLSATNISISAPQLTAYGAGFNVGGAVLETAYAASWLLNSSNHGYSSVAQNFNVSPVLNLVVTMTLDNRITSNAGFASGTYTTRTVVTCS